MAGILGGGGLGVLAINYGYYRYMYDIMIYSIIALVILVQVIQYAGTWLSARLDHRK